MTDLTNPAGRSAERASDYVAAVLTLLGDRPPFEVLAATAGLLADRLDGLTDEHLRRPEAPGKWSVIEVVQHLADSDLVWGWRLRMAIAHDRPRIEGFDQDLWAERLAYRDADPARALEQFRVLRRGNLDLLAGPGARDPGRGVMHSERGFETLERMLQLYAGHDLAHLRQIDRILAR